MGPLRTAKTIERMDNEQQIVSIRDIPVGQLKLVTQDFIDFSGATRVAVTKQDDENYTVTAHVGAKPLVFISASHRDSAWRDRLKAKLQEQGQLDWWNDSKIEPSSR